MSESEDKSPVNEVRDVTPEMALKALDDLDDYARMDTGVVPAGPVGTLLRFIIQHSTGANFKDEESVRSMRFLGSNYLKWFEVAHLAERE